MSVKKWNFINVNWWEFFWFLNDYRSFVLCFVFSFIIPYIESTPYPSTHFLLFLTPCKPSFTDKHNHITKLWWGWTEIWNECCYSDLKTRVMPTPHSQCCYSHQGLWWFQVCFLPENKRVRIRGTWRIRFSLLLQQSSRCTHKDPAFLPWLSVTSSWF